MAEQPDNLLLAGATGLVGSGVVRELLADRRWSGRLIAPVRRRLANDDPRLIPLTADFSDASGDAALQSALKLILGGQPISTFVCCLGTTIRAAGSRAAFIAVDRELVLRLAGMARKLGAQHAILVSSVGASRQSGNFYLRVKGEVEDGIESLGFKRVDLVRPGLLLGERSDRRPREALAQAIAPVGNLFLRGKLARYRSVDANGVSKAIVRLCRAAETGIFVHESPALERLAED